MATYFARVITPHGKFFEDKVDFLSAPAAEGYLGILADHAPLVAMLAQGILKIQKAGVDQFWAISSGVLEVDQNGEVLVLADTALPGNSVEDARAKVNELH